MSNPAPMGNPIPDLPLGAVDPREQDGRRKENAVSIEMIQREGDRLLGMGDEKGGMALLKMAAVLRQRRENVLGPF